MGALTGGRSGRPRAGPEGGAAGSGPRGREPGGMRLGIRGSFYPDGLAAAPRAAVRWRGVPSGRAFMVPFLQIHRRRVHKVLVSGHPAHIGARHPAQRVRLGLVQIRAAGHRDVELHLLRVDRRRRGASALVAVHAPRRPQQSRQQRQRKLGARKLPRRSPQTQRVQQRQASVHLRRRQADAVRRGVGDRTGTKLANHAQRDLREGVHSGSLVYTPARIACWSRQAGENAQCAIAMRKSARVMYWPSVSRTLGLAV